MKVFLFDLFNIRIGNYETTQEEIDPASNDHLHTWAVGAKRPSLVPPDQPQRACAIADDDLGDIARRLSPFEGSAALDCSDDGYIFFYSQTVDRFKLRVIIISPWEKIKQILQGVQSQGFEHGSFGWSHPLNNSQRCVQAVHPVLQKIEPRVFDCLILKESD